MKSNNITLLLCAIIIGSSMIMSSFLQSSLGENDDTKIDTKVEQNELKPLFTVAETAEYLGITESEVWIIIKSSENSSTMSFPTIKIEKNTYISTIGLIEWLRNSIYDNRVYN